MSQTHFVRNHESRHPDEKLNQSVKSQRGEADFISMPPYRLSADPRTQTHPGHEDRQDNRDHGSVYAELRHREPKPDKLIKHTAEAGDEEEDKIPNHGEALYLRRIAEYFNAIQRVNLNTRPRKRQD